MLGSLINFLKEDISAFISHKTGLGDGFVLAINLNNILPESDGIDNKIIISIVNIEEEKILKSPDNYTKTNNEINYRKPPVWLNIICLFTFYSKSIENYTGIDMLSNVVQYFQSKPRIDRSNAVIADNYPADLEELRAEFVSLNYEQTNYLWGLFGGRYHPSVIYKFRTVPIDNMDVTPGGPPISTTLVAALHKK